MATDLYQNKLRGLLEDPSSFQKTPGFQFALDTGLQAVGRSNSRMRGSGNALAALTKYGTGLANQEYGAQVDRLGRLTGQEQQYGLGQEQNRLTGIRDANSLSLGTEQNRLTGARDANNYTLGQGQNANAANRNANDYSLGNEQNRLTGVRDANARHANDQQFGLGMYRASNDYALGADQNNNTAQNNWWNHQTNTQQNNNTAANNQNNFNIANGRNDIEWFNANTNRGQAQSNDYYRGQDNQRQWIPFNPPRRIA